MAEPLTSVWVVGEGAEADRHAQGWWALRSSVDLRRVDSAKALPQTLASRRPPAAASVCVPLAERAEVARTLIDAGVHLLVDAPAALRLAEAAPLSAAARSQGRLFVPAHPILYTPGLSRLMAFVHARRLGPVQNVFTYRYGPRQTNLRYATHEGTPGLDLYVHAALIKTLCLLPESRVSNVAVERRDDGLFFTATMYYDDDILATVRADPDVRPSRLGVMVTFLEAVLQWEVSETDESLTLLRGTERRPFALGSESPHTAMVHRFLRSVQSPVPPYEDADAAMRSLSLVGAWALAQSKGDRP